MNGFAALRALLLRHAVASYFLVAFAVSWTGTLLVIGGPGHIPAAAGEMGALFPAVFLSTVLGPAVAGLLLTGLVDGVAGYRDLLARLVKWRVGVRWYAVAILAAPLSVNAALLALSLAGPQFRPGVPALDASSLLLVGIGVVTALLEETGWTGFAIPRLAPRYGVVITGVSVGLLWGAWHFVSNVWGLSSTGSLPAPLFLAVLLFTFLPPFRVLMVWVYRRTGSLLLAILMHASLVASWLAATPPGIAPDAMAIWYGAWGALLWLAVAVVALFDRDAMSRPVPATAARA